MKGRCKSLRAAVKILARKKDGNKRKEQSKGRMGKFLKKLKKAVKKLQRHHSGEEDETEKERNGSEENEDGTGTARGGKGEGDKEVEKAEKKEVTNEFMKTLDGKGDDEVEKAAKKYTEIFHSLLEEMKKSLRKTEGKTTWKKKSGKSIMKPFWGKGGKAKQENQIKVKSPKKLVRGNSNKRNNLTKDAGKNEDKGNKRKRGKRRKVVRKRKPLGRISKIETPTHLIIKERMKYVKGKGWKINILKIQKSKKLSTRNVNVKKYTIKCNKDRSKCKVAKRQTKNKLRMLLRKPMSRMAINKMYNRRRKTKNSAQKNKKNVNQLGAHNTPPIIRTGGTSGGNHCLRRKAKYTPGKGWVVKESNDCLDPSNTTAEPVIE